jgi:two-component system, cell cycle response regulator
MMRVLIVEDDPVHRRMLEILIGRLGYEALTSSNGREAIERLQSDPAQLVVADWMMPELDGLLLCREIRHRFQERYVYFILVTSRDQRDDLIAAFEAGVDDYLVKPVHQAELSVRIRAAKRILDLQEQLLEAQERLRYQAMHDALTGIWNRGAALDALARELERTGREGSALAVAMIDLDHFKRINDTHGHPVGDEVLREVAGRIRAAVRTYDSVGRYGGEEFLVIAPGIEEPQAVELAERIRRQIETAPIVTAGPTLRVTLSVGVVVQSSHQRAPLESVLSAADQALYKAKRSGRNRSVLGHFPSTVAG